MEKYSLGIKLGQKSYIQQQLVPLRVVIMA